MTVTLKIMYLKLFKNFIYSVVFQNRACSPLWRKQTERWSPLKAAFVTWTFRLPPVFYWTISFHLQILQGFLSSLKLQYCRTIVLLNKLKLFKETSFSKATMVMQFPAKKNAGCLKAPRDFPPRKDGILPPPALGYLGTPLPLPQSLYGRADVRWCHNENFSDRKLTKFA